MLPPGTGNLFEQVRPIGATEEDLTPGHKLHQGHFRKTGQLCLIKQDVKVVTSAAPSDSSWLCLEDPGGSSRSWTVGNPTGLENTFCLAASDTFLLHLHFSLLGLIWSLHCTFRVMQCDQEVFVLPKVFLKSHFSCKKFHYLTPEHFQSGLNFRPKVRTEPEDHFLKQQKHEHQCMDP